MFMPNFNIEVLHLEPISRKMGALANGSLLMSVVCLILSVASKC